MIKNFSEIADLKKWLKIRIDKQYLYIKIIPAGSCGCGFAIFLRLLPLQKSQGQSGPELSGHNKDNIGLGNLKYSEWKFKFYHLDL